MNSKLKIIDGDIEEKGDLLFFGIKKSDLKDKAKRSELIASISEAFKSAQRRGNELILIDCEEEKREQ